MNVLEEWFSDDLRERKDKDVYEKLQGYCLLKFQKYLLQLL